MSVVSVWMVTTPPLHRSAPVTWRHWQQPVYLTSVATSHRDSSIPVSPVWPLSWTLTPTSYGSSYISWFPWRPHLHHTPLSLPTRYATLLFFNSSPSPSLQFPKLSCSEEFADTVPPLLKMTREYQWCHHYLVIIITVSLTTQCIRFSFLNRKQYFQSVSILYFITCCLPV